MRKIFAVSLGVVFSMIALLLVAQVLTNLGVIGHLWQYPRLSAWMPVIVFGVAAIILAALLFSFYQEMEDE